MNRINQVYIAIIVIFVDLSVFALSLSLIYVFSQRVVYLVLEYFFFRGIINAQIKCILATQSREFESFIVQLDLKEDTEKILFVLFSLF